VGSNFCSILAIIFVIVNGRLGVATLLLLAPLSTSTAGYRLCPTVEIDQSYFFESTAKFMIHRIHRYLGCERFSSCIYVLLSVALGLPIHAGRLSAIGQCKLRNRK
jgi:hypothetical protein